MMRCKIHFYIQCVALFFISALCPDESLIFKPDPESSSSVLIDSIYPSMFFYCRGSFVTKHNEHTQPIKLVIWDSMERFFITVAGDGFIFWRVIQGALSKCRAVFQDDPAFCVCSISPHGEFVVFGLANGSVWVYRIGLECEYCYSAAQQLLAPKKSSGSVQSIQWIAETQFIVKYEGYMSRSISIMNDRDNFYIGETPEFVDDRTRRSPCLLL